MIKRLARFDHHPDPAIDFEVEVDTLEAAALNVELGVVEPLADEIDDRIRRALEFKVGGDANSIGAKYALRRLAERRGLIANPPLPDLPPHTPVG